MLSAVDPPILILYYWYLVLESPVKLELKLTTTEKQNQF